MGQYHYPVNLSKREFLNPHKLGDGLKLWEQAASDAGTCAALCILLAASNGRGGGDFHTDEASSVVGRWAGDRIAWVGDYAEDGDLPKRFKASTIYGRCGSGAWEDISELVIPALQAEFDVKISGDGWRSKESRVALKPDVLLVPAPGTR